jgi:hypothetical protein
MAAATMVVTAASRQVHEALAARGGANEILMRVSRRGEGAGTQGLYSPRKDTLH